MRTVPHKHRLELLGPKIWLYLKDNEPAGSSLAKGVTGGEGRLGRFIA